MQNELLEFLLGSSKLYHGFGPIRFARFLETGLILPSGNSWGNPYSNSEIYFSPRWNRAAGAYATENFDQERAKLREIAKGTCGVVTPKVAREALEKIDGFLKEMRGEKIGFVVEMGVVTAALKLQFGNPTEAYRTYRVMFDEDCVRLDTKANPHISKLDPTKREFGIKWEYIRDMYVVDSIKFEEQRRSIREGKIQELPKPKLRTCAFEEGVNFEKIYFSKMR